MKNKLKEIGTILAVLIAVFLAGAFVNGKRVDADWRKQINNTLPVIQIFERYVDVPVPGKPFAVPGKPIKDTTGVAHALDSLKSIYQDSLQQRLAQPFTGIRSDTGIYLRITAYPITQSFIVDSIWIKRVRCDSTVATKTIIKIEKQTASIRTGASVAIGAAAGAKIGNAPGAAIGALVGLAFDWIF